MTDTLNARLRFVTDTAANWTSNNPTLLGGEVGYESDTGRVKVGDGSTAWASLGYSSNTILSGTGAPSAGTGVNGDFYIDTSASAIYGAKSGGSWGSATSLIGSAGADGADGTNGVDGVDGSNGVDGTSFTWSGAWVSSTAYTENEAVEHNGASYMCTSGHTSGGSTEPLIGGSWATVWDVLAEKGDTGAVGATGAAGADGADGADGVTDHGALTGLSDDDHTQYHNTTRANTWLATKTTDNLTEGSTNKYNVQADWNASTGLAVVLNKPTLATVATTGAYSDLSGAPTVPTSTSDLTNDSGFITGYTVTEGDVTANEAAITVSASQVSDFDTEVSNNTDVAANTTARHTHSNKTTLDNITAAYTTAEQSKLSGIETGATADQSDAEIETAYNSQVSQVSSGEKTAGTETAIRRFSPKDVADMAGTHGGGGGGSDIFAYATFDSTGTLSILDSKNVSSITDNGVGNYTLNFSTAASSTNYGWAGEADNHGGTGWAGYSVAVNSNLDTNPIQTGSLHFRIAYSDGAGTHLDSEHANIIIFGG